eukprot:6880883-Prymnesium_polylepis.1
MHAVPRGAASESRHRPPHAAPQFHRLARPSVTSLTPPPSALNVRAAPHRFVRGYGPPSEA